MAKRKYFGTDGIRGPVGSALIQPSFMKKLGLAAGLILKQRESGDICVLIGHDTRESAKSLESALQAGLSQAGVNVMLLGVSPTPAIAHLVTSLGACAGIALSASHNPYQDNGVKFFNAKGMKLSDAVEVDIESRIDSARLGALSAAPGKVDNMLDATERYTTFCRSTFPAELRLDGLKIILDCANGATSHVAPMVFHGLGAEVITTHNTPNGKNINAACGATDIASLQSAVKQHKADIGLAFDGDGDRVILIDHKGEVVDGDEILCVLAHDRLKEPGNDFGVVGTVMSNLGLEQSLKSSGIGFDRSAVGDRYVLESLQEQGWLLGGEASGHIVDLRYTTTGDGIITGLQVLRVMSANEKSLHQLKQVMQKRPQVLINVPIKQKIDIGSHPKVCAAVAQAEQRLNGEGRILLRASGTEPLIRVMVEGNHKKAVQGIAEQIADIVKLEVG
jgi:phosphoglucosamine mutase